jgi:L-arabinose isomerase
MIDFKEMEVWFVTGSQHLYGEAALKKVDQHSLEMVQGLSNSGRLPVNIIFKPVVTTPEAIYQLCLEANNARNCIGLITWMHTFSPANVDRGRLTQAFVHLRTQFSSCLVGGDMDFMNLNQSAHGDREFGFIGSGCS